MWPNRNRLYGPVRSMDCHSETFAVQGNYEGSVSASKKIIGIFRLYSIRPILAYANNNCIVSRLFRLREHGIQSREVDRIYTKRPKCLSHGQSFESVRLIDCQIVLTILAYGFVFSFIIFIIEKIVHVRSIESKLCLL